MVPPPEIVENIWNRPLLTVASQARRPACGGACASEPTPQAPRFAVTPPPAAGRNREPPQPVAAGRHLKIGSANTPRGAARTVNQHLALILVCWQQLPVMYPVWVQR